MLFIIIIVAVAILTILIINITIALITNTTTSVTTSYISVIHFCLSFLPAWEVAEEGEKENVDDEDNGVDIVMILW